MADEIVYIDCPKCKGQLQLTLAAPGPRVEPEAQATAPKVNGLLADLKPWVQLGTITIDQSRDPVIIRMVKVDMSKEGKANWRAVMVLVQKHGGRWFPDKKNSRWEVPA